MLWDIVYDFFVKHIFGGILYENGVYSHYRSSLGGVQTMDGYFSLDVTENQFYKIIDLSGRELSLSLGNYLSLIATIISMVVIVFLCCLLIKKIYNICAHIIG